MDGSVSGRLSPLLEWYRREVWLHTDGLVSGRLSPLLEWYKREVRLHTDGLVSRQLSPDLQATQKKVLTLRMRGVFPCRVLTRDCVMLITSWWLPRWACRAADDGEDGITRLNGPLALTITAYELRNSLPCRIRMAWLFTKSRPALPMAWFLTRAQQRCRVMESGWCCSCGRYNYGLSEMYAGLVKGPVSLYR